MRRRTPVAVEYARLFGANVVLLHILPNHGLDHAAVQRSWLRDMGGPDAARDLDELAHAAA